MTLDLILEWTSVLTALIYVFLAAKGHRICFLFGLISSAIFVYICLNDRLYFDTAINAYYVVMSFVGWSSWKEKDEHLHVQQLSAKGFNLIILTGALSTFLLGYIADQYTDASLSYIDSFTTVFAVLATWMLVRKFIENWLIWIVADAVSIFMYAYKDHMPIAGLFLVYTIIAVYGYFEWRKLIKS